MDCPTRRGQGGQQCFCRRGCRRTGGNRPILCPTGTPAARPRLRPRPDKGGCCPPNSGQVPAASRPAFPLRHRRRLGWYRRCKSRAGRPCLWRPVFRRWAVHRRGGSPSSPPARLRRSNCIFHPVGQKYQNSNQAVRIPFSVVPFSAK